MLGAVGVITQWYLHLEQLCRRIAALVCGAPADDVTVIGNDRFHGLRLADTEDILIGAFKVNLLCQTDNSYVISIRC